MKFKYLIWIILLLSCQNEEIIDDEQECAARVSVATYKPMEFQNENRIPKEISNFLRKEFQDSLGEYLAGKINFTLGFEYNLKEIYENHYEKVKNYQWEIPRFYLNYAIEDTESNITYCMRFRVSEKGEILGRKTPKLSNKYQNQKILTREEAIAAIRNNLDNEELEKVKFEFGDFKYNWRKNVFEWEFGRVEKVWVEAFKNGEIRIAKFRDE